MKFDNDGNALPYPGNTIVCAVPDDDAVHRGLAAMQAGLRDGPWAGCFAFLPADSFHMTLYRGVNDKRRVPEEWPRDLPLDTPLDEMTAIFAERLNGVNLGDGFVMRPEALESVPSGESQLLLSADGGATEARLRDVRDAIRLALNHERPGEADYTFHITFSYRVRRLSEEWEDGLREAQKSLFARFAADFPLIRVGPPRLCRYTDMLAFHPFEGSAGVSVRDGR